MSQPGKPGELTWLLNDLTARVPGLHNAAVLSDDGLLITADQDLSPVAGEHVAALACGYQSLSRAASREFDGGQPIRQITIEMTSKLLVVTTAGKRTCLAVLCSADADVGLVSYEVALLVDQVRAALSTLPRPGLQAHGAS